MQDRVNGRSVEAGVTTIPITAKPAQNIVKYSVTSRLTNFTQYTTELLCVKFDLYSITSGNHL